MRLASRAVAMALLAALVHSPAQSQEAPRDVISAGITVADWDSFVVKIDRLTQSDRQYRQALLAIAATLGVTFRANGRPDVARILGALDDSLKELKAFRLELDRSKAEVSADVAELWKAAEAAALAGDLPKAKSTLARAFEISDTRAVDALNKAALSASLQAQLTSAEGDFQQAAHFYGVAAARAPSKAYKIYYALAQGQQLNRYAQAKGGFDAYAEALEILRSVEGSPDASIYQRRETDLQIGDAYKGLAFRYPGQYATEALKYYRRSQFAPIETGDQEQWVRAEIKLASIYMILAWMDGGADQTNAANAVTALEGALTYISPSQRLYWLETRQSLGDALRMVGSGRKDAEGSRIRAVEILKDTRDRLDPEAESKTWFNVTMSLHAAYQTRSQWNGEPTTEERLTLLRSIDQDRLRLDDPVGWAKVKKTLADDLVEKASEDPATLQSALDAIRESETIISRQAYPLDWANEQNGFAGLLAKTGHLDDLIEASKRLVAALEIFNEKDHPDLRARANWRLGYIYMTIGIYNENNDLNAKPYYRLAIAHSEDCMRASPKGDGGGRYETCRTNAEFSKKRIRRLSR